MTARRKAIVARVCDAMQSKGLRLRVWHLVRWELEQRIQLEMMWRVRFGDVLAEMKRRETQIGRTGITGGDAGNSPPIGYKSTPKVG